MAGPKIVEARLGGAAEQLALDAHQKSGNEHSQVGGGQISNGSAHADISTTNFVHFFDGPINGLYGTGELLTRQTLDSVAHHVLVGAGRAREVPFHPAALRRRSRS
jgi:hypothetical protein